MTYGSVEIRKRLKVEVEGAALYIGRQKHARKEGVSPMDIRPGRHRRLERQEQHLQYHRESLVKLGLSIQSTLLYFSSLRAGMEMSCWFLRPI